MPYKSRNGGYHKDSCAYADLSTYQHIPELPERAKYSDCNACNTLF